ncbi:MAG TPA: hypothetical protein VGG06_29240 [Thermoanaerobaculia bacterium]|jgi:hypothetical protein
MPTPLSPRIAKGAIVAVDPFNPVASVIVFQLNPESLTRSLTPNTTEGGGTAEALRLKGAPTETISAELFIDATDQLEASDPTALRMGIYPQLSALEMLLFPKSLLVVANSALAALGTIEVIPPEAPLTLFVWGLRRIVPVRITSLSVTEEAWDTSLNPIRATVSVDMQVLTYDDLSIIHPGRAIFLANQVLRETMATLGSLDNLSSVVSGDVRLV